MTLVLGCPDASSEKPILSLLRQAVQIAETDGRSTSDGAEGPLIVDLRTLAEGANHATGVALGRDETRRSFGANVRNLSEAEAVRCDSIRCWVIDNGVFVKLDSLQAAADGAFTVFVTSVTTDRRPSGTSAACTRQLSLRFELREGKWVATDNFLMLRC